MVDFARLRLRPETLAPFGFRRAGKMWRLRKPVADGAFVCEVSLRDGDGGGLAPSVRVCDAATGDEYAPWRIEGATGAFVGRVRGDVEATLADIAQRCFKRDVFKGEMTRRLVAYARDTWGDELEFLWQRFPDNAVLRRPDNGKWYAAVLRLPGAKIGLQTDDAVEILDLRRTSATHDARILPGYHMNKQTWITVLLDGSLPFEEVVPLMAASRTAAAGRMRRVGRANP